MVLASQKNIYFDYYVTMLFLVNFSFHQSARISSKWAGLARHSCIWISILRNIWLLRHNTDTFRLLRHNANYCFVLFSVSSNRHGSYQNELNRQDANVSVQAPMKMLIITSWYREIFIITSECDSLFYFQFPPIGTDLLKMNHNGIGKALMYLYKHPQNLLIITS